MGGGGSPGLIVQITLGKALRDSGREGLRLPLKKQSEGYPLKNSLGGLPPETNMWVTLSKKSGGYPLKKSLGVTPRKKVWGLPFFKKVLGLPFKQKYEGYPQNNIW